VVPVHEHGAISTDAEVVASYVHVQQRVTSEVAIGGRPREPRQRFCKPLARTDPGREKRLGLGCDNGPPVEVLAEALEGREPCWWSHCMYGLERLDD
jgi:hypothetical protein